MHKHVAFVFVVKAARSHRCHFAMLWLAILSHSLHGLIDTEFTFGGILGTVVATTQVYGHVYELLAEGIEH